MKKATLDRPTEQTATTMVAMVQDRYGDEPEDVLHLGAVPTPTAGDDQVLVRVHAAGVDRGVWHVMAGLPYPIRLGGYGLRAPKCPVPGMDMAGVVDAVGKGVTRFQPGDEVFGIGKGSYAEYALALEDKLAPKPANLSFQQAAAVAVSGLTALQALRDHGKVQPGDKVLVAERRAGWAPTPCSWARRSAPTSPACAAPPSWTWSVPSAPTVSSTTPPTTSPPVRSATT
ncbi:MAG TPA: NAD(P)-dependent alcohol dehydrogenase [Acidimicrobiales bacterium]|nr:NAD(P)-dependent alcohol dehydrogenase [Acidimicrobiales bacterium]